MNIPQQDFSQFCKTTMNTDDDRNFWDAVMKGAQNIFDEIVDPIYRNGQFEHVVGRKLSNNFINDVYLKFGRIDRHLNLFQPGRIFEEPVRKIFLGQINAVLGLGEKISSVIGSTQRMSFYWNHASKAGAEPGFGIITSVMAPYNQKSAEKLDCKLSLMVEGFWEIQQTFEKIRQEERRVMMIAYGENAANTTQYASDPFIQLMKELIKFVRRSQQQFVNDWKFFWKEKQRGH
jgi:hypothetical protein